MKLFYRGSADGSQAPASKKPGINCDQTGVAKIEAIVYTKDNKKLARSGSWMCQDEKGTLKPVKTGSDLTIVIVGKNADEEIVIRGEKKGVTISGSKDKEYEIDCYDFVPALNTPQDGDLANVGAVHLKWDKVYGATRYRVSVWQDEKMSQLLLKGDTTKPGYVISESLSKLKQYYWQVVAVDDRQNESAGSERWSFVKTFWALTATGSEHTLAIKDGALYAWGNNTYGQLGLGDEGYGTERTRPERVGSDTDWAHVATGPNYSIAIKKGGTMWSWGNNSYQMLGHGDTGSEALSPKQIGKDSDWNYVAVGNHHVVAIKNSGELWAWGNNINGQLGRGDKDAQSRPTYMKSTGWVYVAAGSNHSFGIKTDGRLWAWGNNAHGQLGLSGDEDRLQPVKVGSAKDWAYVATSASHTVAVNTSGELWAWGNNQFGQLGQGDKDVYPDRVQIGTDTDWSYAVASLTYILAIKEGGELRAWGANDLGQLGLGDTNERISYNEENKVKGDNWVYVTAKGKLASAVTADDKIWCWGRNTFGRIGNGKIDIRARPAQVGTDTDWDTIGRGHGKYATFAIKDNGELWAWGNNQFGQLGLGDFIHRKIPKKVGEDAGWEVVANGGYFTLAIKEIETTNGGILWDLSGDENTPSEYSDDQALVSGWVSVHAGPGFWLGIKRTGADPKKTLWARGDNNYGQLGLGVSKRGKNRPDIPEQVESDIPWKAVAAGGHHAVALKSDGSLWTWGRNDYGQLGLGDNKENEEDEEVVKRNSSPARVLPDNSWKWEAVAAGLLHSVAIKEDGTLWSWGCNTYGQLGHGDNSSAVSTPTQVKTEDSLQWQQVAAGDNFTVAITTDGTLWSWGRNKYGQLGYQSTNTIPRPSQIGTDTDWDSVGAGNRHAFALKKNGTLYSWGDNTYGQLGTGDASWQSSPFQVSFEQP